MTLMTNDLNDHEQARMTGTRLSAECKIPKRRTILYRILIYLGLNNYGFFWQTQRLIVFLSKENFNRKDLVWHQK